MVKLLKKKILDVSLSKKKLKCGCFCLVKDFVKKSPPGKVFPEGATFLGKALLGPLIKGVPRIPPYWGNLGISESRNLGISESRNLGISESRNLAPFRGPRNLGISESRNLGISEYRPL